MADPSWIDDRGHEHYPEHSPPNFCGYCGQSLSSEKQPGPTYDRITGLQAGRTIRLFCDDWTQYDRWTSLDSRHNQHDNWNWDAPSKSWIRWRP